MNAVGFVMTRLIHAPNEAVWRVLADFGAEHRWTRTVSQCERDTADVRVGTVRRCSLPRPLMGRTEVREILTEFEPGRALAYVLDGAAGPFTSASSRWSTTPTSKNSTEVTVEGRFELKNRVARAVLWPFAKPMLRRLTRRVVGELETYLLATNPPSSARAN
jgi:uncharacterized protein YndB with AHSA1/START domain